MRQNSHYALNPYISQESCGDFCFLWKPKEQMVPCEGLLSIMKLDNSKLHRPFSHPSMADLQSHANLAAHNRNRRFFFFDYAFEKVLRKRQRCENCKFLPTSEARRHHPRHCPNGYTSLGSEGRHLKGKLLFLSLINMSPAWKRNESTMVLPAHPRGSTSTGSAGLTIHCTVWRTKPSRIC